MSQPSEPVEHQKRYEKVNGQARLYRRDAVYYFRAIVPLELRPIVGKPEIKHSLKTTNFQEAKKKRDLASIKADALFKQARDTLQAAKPAAPAPLSEEELYHVVATWFIAEEKKSEAWATDKLRNYSEGEVQEARLNLIEDAATLANEAATSSSPRHSNHQPVPLPKSASEAGIDVQASNGGHPSVTDSLTDRFLQTRPDLNIARGSNDYNRLSDFLRRASLESLNRRIDRIDKIPFGRYDSQFEALFSYTPPPPAPKKSLTLKQLTDRFMAYQREEHKESTVETYAIPVRALHEVLGETKLITEINQGDIENLVKIIERIPAFVSQRYPKMALMKAIAAADRDGNTKRLAKKSVTKYFNGVHSIFNYAVDKGLLDSLPVRSKSLRKQLREKGGSSKRRELFKDSELKAIFNAPLYTGCVDDERWYAKPGLNVPKRGRYWIPLLALFHGARLQELCQLYCQDVKEENGIAYLSNRLDLDDDEATDKSLKTESSIRDVPVHPELIRMGFLNFVNDRRKDGAKARLFPEINLGKKSKRYSSVFGSWFARFATKACRYKPKGVCHSFRHHFRTALSQANVPLELVDELGGWDFQKRRVSSNYFHANLKQKWEAVSKVRYENLDLSHLYVTPQARFRQPPASLACGS